MPAPAAAALEMVEREAEPEGRAEPMLPRVPGEWEWAALATHRFNTLTIETVAAVAFRLQWDTTSMYWIVNNGIQKYVQVE